MVRSSPFPILLLSCLAVLTSSASADSEYVRFSDEAQRTLLGAAFILAMGMIVAALILRKPR